MATRHYCDHCGTTITKKNIMTYGNIRQLVVDQRTLQQEMERMSLEIRNNLNSRLPQAVYAAQAGMHPSALGCGGTGGSASSNQMNQRTQSQQTYDVELCDSCVPIWLKRVRDLTEKSGE